MNLANKLTVFRIILVPFFVAFLMTDIIPLNLIWAAVVFGLASLTDCVDGKVARKYNLITDFGKFLDPLADKILTISALICFTELGWAEAWAVIVVAAREFVVSGIRLVAAGSEEKIVIPADFSGKLKTAATMIVIILILLMQIYLNVIIGKPNPLSSFVDFRYMDAYSIIENISRVLMYIVAALTVFSGVNYTWKYRSIFKGRM